MKTVQGYECFGKFFIGDNRRSATALFKKLKGKNTVDDKSIIQLDLNESSDGLPVNLQMITCTLEELGENCRIITKELFRVGFSENTVP